MNPSAFNALFALTMLATLLAMREGLDPEPPERPPDGAYRVRKA